MEVPIVVGSVDPFTQPARRRAGSHARARTLSATLITKGKAGRMHLTTCKPLTVVYAVLFGDWG